MSKINKKMMLCAVVGGDIEDYQKMYETNLEFIRCSHSPKIEPCYIENNLVFDNRIITNDIKLKKLAFENELVGYVGKCDCGKIYYSLT